MAVGLQKEVEAGLQKKIGLICTSLTYIFMSVGRLKQDNVDRHIRASVDRPTENLDMRTEDSLDKLTDGSR